MKLSRKWLIVAALVLSVAMATSGTIAYLSDEASAVNVMTLGSVKIKLHEYERVVDANGNYTTIDVDGTTSYELKEFSQGKPLLPATEVDANGLPYNYGAGDYDTTRVKMSQVDSHGSMDVFVNKNAQDKFITVENTGKSDAYVRTLIAFEIGELTVERFDDVISTSSFMTTQGVWKVTDIGIVEIDGNNYYVSEYLYNGAKDLGGVHENGVLPKGDTTYPSLAQVYMRAAATNEDCEAIDGNGNGTYDILVVAQAVQADGFADAETALNVAFGDITVDNHPWMDNPPTKPVTVYTAAELQKALDDATDGAIILLGDDIEGDVTATQKPDVKVTLEGCGYTFDGSIIVNGKSARYPTTGLTIKNVNFDSADNSLDAFINLGKSGDNNTRYTNNVTVSGCTFNYTGTGNKVAVKSYTGGDKNLTVTGCTVKNNMHSAVQVDNIEEGLTITDCKVNSKNGINLNYTPSLEMSGCEFDTTGYCVRVGVNGYTLNGIFNISDSALKSACDDGDAVIIVRGNAAGSTLNLTNTTLTGATEITNPSEAVVNK